MIPFRQLIDIPADRGPVSLAVGFFDGVHLGHGRVLEAALARARTTDGRAWALTFEPHPLRVLNPHLAPPLLTPVELKIHHILDAGVEGCAVLPFTREFADLTPDQFVSRLRDEIPPLTSLSVGSNWRFGRDAAGNVDLLHHLASCSGLTVDIVPPVEINARPVSSTRIREAVLTGDLEAAAAMLGRPYSVAGQVVHGHFIGHELGYPTANVSSRNEVWPPTGVYAVFACLDARRVPGAAYFGRRPTFDPSEEPLLEVHLFGENSDLYGRTVEVFFLERIRADMRFSDTKALKAQIAVDVRHAEEIAIPWLASSPPALTGNRHLSNIGRDSGA